MEFALVTKQRKGLVDLQKTKILYDWVTFSIELPFESVLQIMFGPKFRDIPFEYHEGSNRFYENTAVYQHIRIHYSESEHAVNFGCCVEMSGQGCREYEDIDYRSLEDLVHIIDYKGGHISRLDVAFDDKHNHFPIFDMAELSRAALAREFTARSSRFKVDYSASDRSDDLGISVQHGSRKSDFYLRIYDKRAERGVFDKLAHWVRCEMQLKNDVAMAFVHAIGSVGLKFRQLLAHYVNYRVPNDLDTNKRRWVVADWWQKLLDGVQAVQLLSRCFTSYNKGKLDDFVFKRCAKAIFTALVCDKFPDFVNQVVCSVYSGVLSSKYTSLIAQITGKNPDLFLDDFYSLIAAVGLPAPADPAPSL